MRKILAMVAVMLLGTIGVQAEGTLAGTSVANSASLSYTAGGAVQPAVGSNTDTFTVDKKIDMVLVTTNTEQQSATLGQVNVETTYTFTNEGNADQNFTFSVSDLSSGATIASQADYNALEDNNTALNLKFDCNASGTWTAAGTTALIHVQPNETFTCIVRADMPVNGSALDGDVMNVELLAIAVESDGTTHESNTTTADNQGGNPDVVLAEGTAGTLLLTSLTGKGDTSQDGEDAGRSGYIIHTPVIDLKKISCVYQDPINGTTNPKRIPGATILYVFDINNTGSLDATGITLTDTLQADLDGVPIANVQTDVNATTAPCVCADGSHYTVGGTAGTNTDSDATQDVSIQNIEVGAGKHTCVSFEVDIK